MSGTPSNQPATCVPGVRKPELVTDIASCRCVCAAQVEALRPALQGALQQVQALLASEKAAESSRGGPLHGAGGGGGGGSAGVGGGTAAAAKAGKGGRAEQQQQQQQQERRADGEQGEGMGLLVGVADRREEEGEGLGGRASMGSWRATGGDGEGRGTKKRRKGDT